MPALDWQKSTFSGDQANCVNVAATPDRTLRLRESDAPEVVLSTSARPLAALLRALQEGSTVHG
jgi:hypothetical protein